MRYVAMTLLVLGGLMWCTQGFAVGLGNASFHVYPNVQPAPVKARTLTPAQLKAYEQAKALRSPMTTGRPMLKAGPVTREKQIKKEPSGSTLNFKGQQGGLTPLWGTNTTVFSGGLEYRGTILEKNISFDFDPSGNLYATTDAYASTWPATLQWSVDNGLTWNNYVSWNNGTGYIHQTKGIIVQTDSLFFYGFTVDSLNYAVVLRFNMSAGTANWYTLGTNISRIAAAWDLDTSVPYFHVALLDNTGQVWYVRGTSQGTSWSAPYQITTTGMNSIDIAVGDAGGVTNNIFMAGTWAPDSSVWAFYDSSGNWVDQLVSENDGQACTEAAVAASHSTSGPVVVYVTYTYAYTPSTYDYDIHESYNMTNGQNAWTVGYGVSASLDYEWGSSLNCPNTTTYPGFVNIAYNRDVVSTTYSVQQDWLTDGYNDPTSWNGPTSVADYQHSYTVYPYASSTPGFSCVLYPGNGPTNVYYNAYWFTGVEQGPAQVTPKTGFSLAEARPNPISRSAAISFSLPRSGQVELGVYDVVGRKVATLAKGQMSAGTHEASWNASSAPAGVYFYRLNFEGKTLTNRMVVVR